MGLFSMSNSASFAEDNETYITNEQMAEVKEELMAIMLAEDVTFGMNDSQRKAFLDSDEFAAITEGHNYKKNTMVRLNKEDDLTRRASQAAIIIAGQKNDRLHKLLALNREKERKLRALIFKKYRMPALKAAKESQREYIKSENKAKVMKVSDINNREYNV